jgi:YHS domain-containing protein
LRLLFWLAIGYLVYLMFKGRPKKNIPVASSPQGEETLKDPVCGVYVTRDDAVIGNMEGEKLYFCSMQCLEKFQEQLSHKS